MPIEYEVISGIVVSTCSGVVTGRDIRNVIASYVDNRDAARPHREIFDLREVGSYEINGDDVRMVVEYVRTTGDRFKGGKVAYVANRDMPYGMGRMFSFFAEDLGINIQVFRDLDEACSWLGISSDTIDRSKKG
jgi:hypothetical protein